MTKNRHLIYPLPFLCLVLVFAFSTPSDAQSPLKIFSYYLKERLSYDGDLGYNKVLDNILRDVKQEVTVNIAPLRRSSLAFARTPDSCTYPANEMAWRSHLKERQDIPLISSLPLDMVSVRIYTRLDQPKIQHADELKGKMVGHMIGSAGKAILDKDDSINFYGVEREEILLGMLTRKRVDAILGFHPDMPMAMDRLGFDQAHFADKYAVLNVPVHIMCHKTERTIAFIETVDKHIRQIRTSGKLQKLLGPYAIIAPLTKTDSSPEH